MERKMAMVVTFVKMEEQDQLDVQFWQSKPASERLAEVTRLRINYYTWLNGSYPKKIAKVVAKRTL
ncbi:hypothetical protein [Mucilaginibacter arboris]|uniref:Uncharacterized protein n=1 Tax=Mucilaginibacter arboris TaxID=2682090 RepID=A0A7K1SVH2_9SPHI|nr:hypothetical protein [Mucilaginibacter arboris]MVN21349.1 hypothetical protein [Mucilaginibacter arboris]